MNKSMPLWEQHLEKIVLGLALVVYVVLALLHPWVIGVDPLGVL